MNILDLLFKTPEKIREEVEAQKAEDAYFEAIADIAKNTTESLLKLADKYGKDRDDEVFRFYASMIQMCMEGTFRKYEFDKEVSK